MEQITEITPLIKSHELRRQYGAPSSSNQFVADARQQIADIIHGKDQRLLVIVGPCSIHDVEAAYAYAEKLRDAARRYADDLYIVMRVYFEKPRSVLGWGGFLNDPHLDQTFDINFGLRAARRLLLNIIALGLPTATEFLEPSVTRYYSDLICWNAVGARTVTSQIHRQLASSLAMPVGFKNTLDGNIKMAVDAMQVARHSHHIVGMTSTGEHAILKTLGNANGHLILRGSNTDTNYSTAAINAAVQLLQKDNHTTRILIDCSHGNSLKNYLQQKNVVDAVITLLKTVNSAIGGVMLESNLLAGNQAHRLDKPLVYGQSITDGCISWDETVIELEKLAAYKHSSPSKDKTQDGDMA